MAGFKSIELLSFALQHHTQCMITDAQGELLDVINLENSASKGKSGGIVWMNKELKLALIDYRKSYSHINAQDTIIQTERNKHASPQVIVNTFQSWYKKLGYEGCSSHSGRRTFITNAARKISTVGGSIRDVQSLARHSSLQMTQRYIECDVEAQKRVVQLI